MTFVLLNFVTFLDYLRSHYRVNLESLEVGGQLVNLSTNSPEMRSRRRTIIDSGSSLAYLPSEVYQQVLENVC